MPEGKDVGLQVALSTLDYWAEQVRASELKRNDLMRFFAAIVTIVITALVIPTVSFLNPAMSSTARQDTHATRERADSTAGNPAPNRSRVRATDAPGEADTGRSGSAPMTDSQVSRGATDMDQKQTAGGYLLFALGVIFGVFVAGCHILRTLCVYTVDHARYFQQLHKARSLVLRLIEDSSTREEITALYGYRATTDDQRPWRKDGIDARMLGLSALMNGILFVAWLGALGGTLYYLVRPTFWLPLAFTAAALLLLPVVCRLQVNRAKRIVTRLYRERQE